MTELESTQVGLELYLHASNVLCARKVLGSRVSLALASIVDEVLCDLTKSTTFLADYERERKKQIYQALRQE